MRQSNLNVNLLFILIIVLVVAHEITSSIGENNYGPVIPPKLNFNQSQTFTKNRRHVSTDRYGFNEETYQQMRQGMNALRKAHALRENRAVSLCHAKKLK